MSSRFSCLLLLLLTPGLYAAALPHTGAVHSALPHLEPSPPVQWDVARALTVDMTCDGKPDTVVLGYQGHAQIWLSVRQSTLPGRPLLMPLILEVGKPGAPLCQSPIRLSSEPLSGQPGGELSPDKARATCQSLILEDGRCAPIRVQWNPQQQALEWQRR